MNQRHAVPLLFACAMTLLTVGAAHAADSTCLYQSRSYSEGAYICVQKSLMQSCTSDSGRMVWKVVADRELGDRCVAPLTYAEPPRRRVVHRARVVRRAAAPVASVSAKCFVFNGKQYCE